MNPRISELSLAKEQLEPICERVQALSKIYPDIASPLIETAG